MHTGTTSNGGNVPTVVDNLLSQGFITTEEIGISFEPTTSESSTNGELDFGGTDSSKFTGIITFTYVYFCFLMSYALTAWYPPGPSRLLPRRVNSSVSIRVSHLELRQISCRLQLVLWIPEPHCCFSLQVRIHLLTLLIGSRLTVHFRCHCDVPRTYRCS